MFTIAIRHSPSGQTARIHRASCKSQPKGTAPLTAEHEVSDAAIDDERVKLASCCKPRQSAVMGYLEGLQEIAAVQAAAPVEIVDNSDLGERLEEAWAEQDAAATDEPSEVGVAQYSGPKHYWAAQRKAAQAIAEAEGFTTRPSNTHRSLMLVGEGAEGQAKVIEGYWSAVYARFEELGGLKALFGTVAEVAGYGAALTACKNWLTVAGDAAAAYVAGDPGDPADGQLHEEAGVVAYAIASGASDDYSVEDFGRYGR